MTYQNVGGGMSTPARLRRPKNYLKLGSEGGLEYSSHSISADFLALALRNKSTDGAAGSFRALGALF